MGQRRIKDMEDYFNLAQNIRARGAVVRARHGRGKAADELKEIAESIPALTDEQIALVVYTLAIAD